ncbi:MAG: proteasome subunit beta [Candidatus Woesearchaeota archaeon]
METKIDENYLKGTTTVGILCKDGIVLAADKRATAGTLIVNKKTDKIYEISNNMVITMAGTVSDAQLLSKLIKAELQLKKLRTGREPNVKESANLLAGMVYANIRRMSLIPGISHFLLGGRDDSGYYLYDIFADGSLTQCDEFVCSGSGSVFAYGVLETLYNPNIVVNEGVDLAIKAMNAALQRDSASGNGFSVVTITSRGITRIVDKNLDMKLK